MSVCPNCEQRQKLNEALMRQQKRDLQLVTDNLLAVIMKQERAIEALEERWRRRERRHGRHFAVVPVREA